MVEKHEVIYRNAVGEEVRLIVPWGYYSGRIPPPIIAFYVGRTEVQFVYSGDAPSESA